MSDRTTVYEMREMADMSGFQYNAESLIKAERFVEYPYRDYDQLVEVVESSESIQETADCLDCHRKQIRRWCEVYGIQTPSPQMADKLDRAEPDAIGGD